MCFLQLVIFSQSSAFSFFFYNINDECFVSKLCVISNNFFLSFLYILQEFYPTDSQLGYIMDLLYNAFFCFEIISECSLDDVVCGICGICPEICLGDGNEKNCCSNAQVHLRFVDVIFKLQNFPTTAHPQ